MAIRIEHVGDVTVLRFAGKLIGDPASGRPPETETGTVQSALAKLLDSGQKKMLLDLEQATAMDDVALGVLVRFQVTAGRQRSLFRICGLRKDIDSGLCPFCLTTLGHFEIGGETPHRVPFVGVLQTLHEACGIAARVRVERLADLAIVHLGGLFGDELAIKQLDEHMQRLLKTSPNTVLIEFDGFINMSAAAVAVIVSACTEPTEPVPIVFAAPLGSDTRNLLKECAPQFRVYRSREEALEALEA